MNSRRRDPGCRQANRRRREAEAFFFVSTGVQEIWSRPVDPR
jgi:hypothetical protein